MTASFSLSLAWSSSLPGKARCRARARGICSPVARPATHLRILRAIGTLLLGGGWFQQRFNDEAYVPQSLVSLWRDPSLRSLRSLVLLGFHAEKHAPGSVRCPTKALAELPKVVARMK